MNARPFLLAAALVAAAPAFGHDLRLEYGRWGYDVTGQVDENGSTIDFERDIDVSVRSRSSFAAQWSSGPDWIPDLAATYLHVDAGGRKETATLPPGPLPGPTTTTVTLADADLRDAQLTLRYPWQAGPVVLSGGVTVERLDGDLTTRNANDTRETRENVSDTFPLLHGAVSWPIGERASLDAAIDWISSNDDRALEWRVGGDLRVVGPVGITAAWQRRHYRVSTAHDRLDTTLDGAVLGIYARFR